MPRLPHPPVAAPMLANEKAYVYDGMLAVPIRELRPRCRSGRASYLNALRPGAGNAALIKAYAHFLFATEKVRASSWRPWRRSRTRRQAAFDLYSLRGKAYYHLARYARSRRRSAQGQRAVRQRHFGAQCPWALLPAPGQPAEARKALSASLKINGQQPDIATLLKQLPEPK